MFYFERGSATIGAEKHIRRYALGTGKRRTYPFRGKMKDVLVLTADLSVKLDLTVTKLLHNVDVVLGMNWLCTVNPIIDWRGARMFIPESLGSSFLAGFWLDAVEKTGTVKVTQDKDKLSKIQQQTELTAKISVLSTPQFGSYTGEKKEWKKESEGDKNVVDESEICITSDCISFLCKIFCKNDSTDVVPKM